VQCEASWGGSGKGPLHSPTFASVQHESALGKGAWGRGDAWEEFAQKLGRVRARAMNRDAATETVVRPWANKRTLPPVLQDLIDFQALAEQTGRDASSLRRTASAAVSFLLMDVMPHQPRAGLLFLIRLQELLIQDQWLRMGFQEAKAEALDLIRRSTL
jgi:hypothetical protein